MILVVILLAPFIVEGLCRSFLLIAILVCFLPCLLFPCLGGGKLKRVGGGVLWVACGPYGTCVAWVGGGKKEVFCGCPVFGVVSFVFCCTVHPATQS